MKEEKNKKKCIKKENNSKCGQDCTGDDGRLVEVKKLKNKNPMVINTENDLGWNGSGENKKKKKRFVTESLNEAPGTDFKNEIEKKVRKKKKRDHDENQEEIVQGSVEVEEKKHRKEKKVKNKSAQMKSENVQIDVEKQPENDKLLKKTKKDKKVLVDDVTEGQHKKNKNTINEETSVIIDGSVKKKKKKAKMNISENEAKSETPETVEVKKKKKRKKEDGNEVDAPEVKSSVFNMKKDESTESEIATIEEEEMEPKKKKRKKKTSKVEEEQPLSLQCEDEEKQKGETLGRVASDTKSKKKKVSIKEESQVGVTFETSAKKKTKEKMENKNESTQRDQASPPQQRATPTGFGQWSSAQFDSSDQQQKFLRLMGGFKKSFQPSTGNTGRANMALGKDAQQQLQQGLQGEFERAHSRRLDTSSRGAGLGFAAPCNKKFSIDVNACRSVRFDD